MWLLASQSSMIGLAVGAAMISFFLIRHARRQLASPRHLSADSSRAGSHRKPVVASGAGPNGPVGGFSRDAARARHDVELLGPEGGLLSAEVSRAQLQLHETARELLGELDTKMRGLQVLIRMADEACHRLEAAKTAAEGGAARAIPASTGTEVDGRDPLAETTVARQAS